MKPPHNPLLRTPVRPLPKRIAVIGAGTIGPDIGYYLKSALPALELVLVDVRQEALDRALARFGEYAGKAVKRGKLTAAQGAAVTQGIRATTDYEAIRGADWVLNSDAEIYGGSGLGNRGGMHSEPIGSHGHAQSIVVTAPPLAVVVFVRE